MEGLQTAAPESSFAADQKFHLVANSLAKLLETARRELERDREAARRRWSQHRTSCKRRSSAVPALTAPQGAVWRLGRSFEYELTLTATYNRTIHIRDLSAVARRSRAHFSRKFKLAVGESPHAYVVRGVWREPAT